MPRNSARPKVQIAEGGTSANRSRSAPVNDKGGGSAFSPPLSSARASRSNSVFDSANFLARQQAKRLQSRREKFVDHGEYQQAAKIHAQLSELLDDHQAIESEKVQMRMMQEHLMLISGQSEQLREFNAEWATRMRKFNARIVYMRGTFRKEQKDARKAHLKHVRSEQPQLKYSKQLQLLQNQAASLARLEKYDEAVFVKREAEKYEAAEIADFNARCDNVSRLGGKESFFNTQKNDQDVFEQKIELDWMRLNVEKRRQTEELLKKQANERSRFMTKMKSEQKQTAVASLLGG